MENIIRIMIRRLNVQVRTGEKHQYDFTVVELLKSCSKRKDLCSGIKIHDDVLKKGLLERNPYVASSLISMYIKCGAIGKAREVLNQLPYRDIVSWSVLIAGYAQHGQGHEALKCYEYMRSEGLYPNAVTFICILKACGNTKDIEKGKEIHGEVDTMGLLNENIMLGTAVVDMYVKCGMLAKAQEVLYELPIRDEISWNALIAGYAHCAKCDKALKCLELMEHESLFPNGTTFTCILKACGSVRAIGKGKEIHEVIISGGMLEGNNVLGNALVDMYAKCGMLAEAKGVHQQLTVRDVASWNALIGGYAQHDQGNEALKCFNQMQSEGFSPDAITYVCILNACGNIGAIDKGKEIHEDIVVKGLLKKNIVLGNALVDMYAKCGFLSKAKEVLHSLPIQDTISWNALIAGYVQEGQNHEALKCFEQMQDEGLCPDAVTFTSILKVCGTIRAAEKGKSIHDEIVARKLLDKNIVLGTALVDMYAKCGLLIKAEEVHTQLPIRTVVSWSALISGYVQQGQGDKALRCFDQMKREGLSPDVVTFTSILKAVGITKAIEKGKQIHDEITATGLLLESTALATSLIDMYCKCGLVAKAHEVLDDIHVRTSACWNALISGYIQQDQGCEALKCFEQMQKEGISPSEVTIACILKACGSTRAIEKGKQIHEDLVGRKLLEKNIFLGNVLVDMYAKCGLLEKADEVFHQLPVRDLISWNTLIGGYVQSGQSHEALKCLENMQNEGLSGDVFTFLSILKACSSAGAIDKGRQIHDEIVSRQLLDKCSVLGTALVQMYANCGELTKAQQVLDELPIRNAASWAVLIAGYTQHDQGYEAVNCFKRMQNEGHSPDVATLISILKVCCSITAVDKGREIHDEIVNRGLLQKHIVLGNALVDMYAKCGLLARAEQLLLQLPVRDVVSWNALIAGYAQEGQGFEALNCFKRMQNEGVHPDGITMLSILNACCHSGLVAEAQKYFGDMNSKYGITSNLEHHTCMVDVFVRAGDFDKAMSMVENAPLSNHPPIWLAILSACRKWGNVNLGRFAFDKAVHLDSNNAVYYSLMSDIYADAGMQEDAKNVEVMRLQNAACQSPCIGNQRSKAKSVQHSWVLHHTPDDSGASCMPLSSKAGHEALAVFIATVDSGHEVFSSGFNCAAVVNAVPIDWLLLYGQIDMDFPFIIVSVQYVHKMVSEADEYQLLSSLFLSKNIGSRLKVETFYFYFALVLLGCQ